MQRFFSKEEEVRIIQAIEQAEKQTSGEIRVHLESHAYAKPLVAAVQTFNRLKMYQTKARNAVLVFIVPSARTLAIIGDKGIDAVVGQDFWQQEKELLQQHFRQQQFCEGVCKVVEQIGEKLKTHFPYESDDQNELPDKLSYN